MRWPWRRRRRDPPSTGIYVDAPGAHVDLSDNLVEGFDRGIDIRGAGLLHTARNVVRRGPRSARDWTVLTLALMALAVVVAVLAWLLPVG